MNKKLKKKSKKSNKYVRRFKKMEMSLSFGLNKYFKNIKPKKDHSPY